MYKVKKENRHNTLLSVGTFISSQRTRKSWSSQPLTSRLPPWQTSSHWHSRLHTGVYLASSFRSPFPSPRTVWLACPSPRSAAFVHLCSSQSLFHRCEWSWSLTAWPRPRSSCRNPRDTHRSPSRASASQRMWGMCSRTPRTWRMGFSRRIYCSPPYRRSSRSRSRTRGSWRHRSGWARSRWQTSSKALWVAGRCWSCARNADSLSRCLRRGNPIASELPCVKLPCQSPWGSRRSGRGVEIVSLCGPPK